jgi:hypothetical protein
VLQRHLHLLRETQGLLERRQRLQAGSRRLAAKIDAAARLQPMLELL